MGGVVSTGRDNDDLVDNLKEAEYIKSEKVEDVFRVVDRAHYYLPECRESAYKDLAWKSGTLHLSAPCIYSEVMEALELRSGLSFLNIGSGTGYLNTMVGYMIGPFGINHGIELHASNVTYAEERLKKFKEICQRFDDLELCDPVFVQGNCLSLAPDNRRFDRVYCGAACPAELISTVQNMIKIQGILVVPVGDQLLKIKRLSETDFASENVLPVSFASLVEPSTPKDVQELIMLPDVNPMSLQDICRITVREAIRRTFTFAKHTPKHSAESSRQSKILQSTVYRHERGRYPLNILPTTQGLMIMGAFTDDSDDSDDSEVIDGGFLDQQLQQHARQRMQNLDTAEVDSNLSDDDEHKSEDGTAEDATIKSASYFRSARAKPESIESEDGIVADDEEDEDETDMKEISLGMKDEELPEEVVLDDSHPRGYLPDARTKTFRINCTENGTTKRLRVAALERRTWVETREIPKPPTVNLPSVSSDEEVIAPKSSVNSSQAIEMNVLDSNARTTKTSYSTSAETSETSGFGSLGDDQAHIGSVHSGLSNFEDDTVVTADNKSDKSSSGACMLSNSTGGKEKASKIKKPAWLEFSHRSDSSDDDAETANDEGEVDEAWMDIDDDDDNGTGIRPIGETMLEGPETHKLIQDIIECPSLPPSGFTIFLKKQVEELPIPGPMKTYICHFR